MKTVHKFNIPDVGIVFPIKMPVGAEILTTQFQNGKFQLWALVDPEREKETRIFTIYGTGWDIEETNVKHIATVQVDPFVWHVFELVSAKN